MELTKPQKRELLWLASVCDDSGAVNADCFVRRHEVFDGKAKDLAARYQGLKALGYVDSLLTAYSQEVLSTRITDEGRIRAVETLNDELKNGAFPKELTSEIKLALSSPNTVAPFELATGFFGLM